MCVCVFIHLFKIYLQQQFIDRRATSTGNLPSRPLLDAIWLNGCRRKPCPSDYSQNVAIIDAVIWKRV